jgi:hypothetical protein
MILLSAADAENRGEERRGRDAPARRATMSTATYFEDELDLRNGIPGPAWYRSRITTGRFRRSAAGNRMLQVVYALGGVAAGHDRVAEYFVLDAPSPRGRIMARMRLVDLYRACGLSPQKGDAIDPADLVDAEIEVKLEHDHWDGQTRLRVVAHRRLVNGVESEGSAAPF